MSCLIVSDLIRIQVNSRDVAVTANDVTDSTAPLITGRSALQRPEMSRLRLSALLRRSRRRAPEAARLSWTLVLGRRKADCANSNGLTA